MNIYIIVSLFLKKTKSEKPNVNDQEIHYSKYELNVQCEMNFIIPCQSNGRCELNIKYQNKIEKKVELALVF